MARLPAMFGASMLAGLAYLQYQATQAGNYAIDALKRAGDTVADTSSNLFSGAKGIADQIGAGWQKTKDDTHLPEWMQQLFQKGEGSGEGGSGPEGPNQSHTAAAAAAASGAALGLEQSDEEDKRSDPQVARDDQMMVLTRKMIEIRSILNTVGQGGALTLPSIVVIGSQSSGKSSVLEAIVGHEFLPKGTNMVTRRPIELTLINTPDAKAEYGEFPALGLGKITDFSQIQRTLTDLNLAVPAEQCVTDDPIQLSIYSPNVPDLSLIDLPGYIQVSGKDQPPELKQKIADLCDKYIQPPNVILAISAADVDLANSTALRSSRRVDPRGERTIGVITKMDLVDAARGAEILTDRKYPLRLGYVGVVCKIPQSAGLFSRTGQNVTSAIVKNENAYFSAHPLQFGPQSELAVGTTTLRHKLMHVLEQTMAASLATTRDAIVQELEEATYEFKVQYNDRPLSAESYLAESLDSFKHSFKEFSEHFGRPQVRALLKEVLDQKVMDLLAKRYWNKPVEDLAPIQFEADPLAELPKADPNSLYWQRKLDASTGELTKLGVGRLATTVVATALQSQVDNLIASSTFAAHPYAQKAIVDAASSILNDRFYSTSDQVENCIKPFKFEIEVENNEWSKGRENAGRVLKGELKACEGVQKQLEDVIGKKKLKDVMGFIDRVRKGDVVLEGDGTGGAGGFSSALLQRGREAVFLRDRADILKMRLMAVKSKQCANLKNKYYCPEVFLDVVADKLTSTAVLFLNVELLSEFYYNFPRELDIRLGRHLSQDEIERFAREDPRVRKHLDVIRRKDMLELVLSKIESLRQLEGRANQSTAGAPVVKERGRWSLF
ncbi:mitochondrial dynamin GTPase Msp1 [Elasticomyces elasticus]|uniref:dynamin GTPase n=1 Tax=Exophiala sideris TaxID=1016849 RepID=A0ABR0J1J2_9EURO|nr:mitochondrial dynamin GTPase Msp1 [Elasticomyces elasticus]KAK5024613.1 mitochondrial dynamin GTPase Msp1 [Exophiala sideris]KAK5030706.1 mitochondrial dynamin GTPase Msp1 [Exophiala sideris]KAK5054246.1 mitochondrial dynamin GTPase Msp1 [Exophiala sideris]KAK5179648.1 mitochondrial dynamin GTPase Msp1 [Eurotiomycetes sp. CCFEE 6388]